MPAFSRLLMSTVAIVSLAGSAGAQTVLSVDATAQAEAPRSSHLKMGTQTAPGGHSISANNQYLTKDGQPWLPVMGEFHYTRFPPQYWEEEIEKIKASGVSIIAAYVIWNHHEERSGEFNFSGDRDLRRFLTLCARHDMKVVMRIGPWAHGEVRYGGTPDWVVDSMPTRQNDAAYLAAVKRYWGQLALQSKGMMFKDGGPVIAVQLENEYNAVGPGKGAEHIATLKAMARAAGFDAPLYTVTGWDGTTYPKGEVVPVFGGYPDEPWSKQTGVMKPNEVYAFRFDGRVAGNAGAQTPAVTRGTAVEDLADTPFLGAEYAGGLPIMYRRRPLVSPDDIAAMMPVQLGSGTNLYGFYMYHGGRNPQGYTTLEENALLGAYNDLPILNYDFQAPFGQYGEAHPVLNAIRPFTLFMNAFGSRLAPMAVHRPAQEPKDRADLTTPRYSARSTGKSGFVFMSNYVRQYAMAEQKDVQFKVQLPGEALSFPSQPVTVATGAYFIWPFHFDLDGIDLVYASAQPVTRIADGADVTYVFAAQDGIAPEFAFADGTGIQVMSGTATSANGRQIISGIMPSRDVALSLKGPKGTVSVVVLSAADARRVSQIALDGKPRLILSDATAFSDGKSLTLRAMGDAHFNIGVFPPLDETPKASLPLALVKTRGIFQTFRAEAPAVAPKVTVTRLREAGEAAAIRIGGRSNTAMQPYPESYGVSAAWSLSVEPVAMKGVSDLYLSIDYQGDVGRLFSGDTMIDDQFWYGQAWQVGLKRFSAETKKPLTLTVLPLRADSPVYIDDAYRPKGDDKQVAELKSVTVTPEYELVLTPAAKTKKR